MKATIIKNGYIKVILIPEDEMDKLALKAINGSVANFISDNLRLYDIQISEGIIIDSKSKGE